MLSGILAVDKPAGWTSHDVVARIRRIANQKQVGHAGTLDPLATGVLMVVLGQATRLSENLMRSSKEYCADVVLGATTVTDDAEAPLEHRCPVPDFPLDQIEQSVLKLVGTLDQIPPTFSAVRSGGERLYVRARRGESVEARARTVQVHSIRVEEWQRPRLRLRIGCGPGTYIRSMARDLGADLDVGAYLHSLRRTRSGGFTILDCHTLEELASPASLRQALLPPDHALTDLHAVVLSDSEVRDLRNGKRVHIALSSPATSERAEVRAYETSGRLVALARLEGDSLKPIRVFAGASGNDVVGS